MLSHFEYTPYSRRLYLADNIMLSTKPEVHNMLHCRQRWPNHGVKLCRKFREVRTCFPEICLRTDRQTNMLIAIRRRSIGGAEGWSESGLMACGVVTAGGVVYHNETVRLQADQVGTARRHDWRLRHRRRLIHRRSHWNRRKSSPFVASLGPHSTTPTPTSSRGRLPRAACYMYNFRKSRVSDVSARIIARMSVSVSWIAGFITLSGWPP